MTLPCPVCLRPPDARIDSASHAFAYAPPLAGWPWEQWVCPGLWVGAPCWPGLSLPGGPPRWAISPTPLAARQGEPQWAPKEMLVKFLVWRRGRGPVGAVEQLGAQGSGRSDHGDMEPESHVCDPPGTGGAQTGSLLVSRQSSAAERSSFPLPGPLCPPTPAFHRCSVLSCSHALVAIPLSLQPLCCWSVFPTPPKSRVRPPLCVFWEPPVA